MNDHTQSPDSLPDEDHSGIGRRVSSDPPLYLYMITNRKPDVQTSTRIGCVSDMERRMAIHNSKVPVPGSERRARQAAGFWKPLLVIVVPPTSGLSARALADEWSSGARRIHCRFEYGIDRIARHYELPYFVDTDELRQDDRIMKALPELCTELIRTAVIADREHVDRVARQVVSERFRPATTRHFNHKSFAKTDRPRRRSRRRLGGGGGGGGSTSSATPAAKSSSKKRRITSSSSSSSSSTTIVTSVPINIDTADEEDSDWEPVSPKRSSAATSFGSAAATDPASSADAASDSTLPSTIDTLLNEALAGRLATPAAANIVDVGGC